MTKKFENDSEAMRREKIRVNLLLADAYAEMAGDNGNLRFFCAALLAEAMRIFAEVEGPEHVQAAILKIGKRDLPGQIG